MTSSAGGVKMPLNMFVLIVAHLGFFQRQVVREGHIDLLRDFFTAQSTGVDRLCEEPTQNLKSHQLPKKNPNW